MRSMWMKQYPQKTDVGEEKQQVSVFLLLAGELSSHKAPPVGAGVSDSRFAMQWFPQSQGPPVPTSPLLAGHLPYCKSLLISCLRDCWERDLQSSVRVYSDLARFGREQEPMCFCWLSQTWNPQGLLSCFHLIAGSSGERQMGRRFLLPCDAAVCWIPFQNDSCCVTPKSSPTSTLRITQVTSP